MPYSAATLAKKKLEKYQNRLIEAITKTCYDALDLTVYELYKEASKLYDKCIDQFYEYKTRSYYRHETGRGTCIGMNLYRSSKFKINYGADGRVSSLHMGWNADDMASYKPWKDKDGIVHPVDKDYVLNNVVNGIRGLEDEYMPKSFAPYDNHWSATVKTQYFGTLSGTPDEIFDEFKNQWESVSSQVFRKNFKALYKPIKRR